MHFLFCYNSDNVFDSASAEDRFVKRRAPQALEFSLQRSYNEIERLEESIKLPKVLNILKWITFIIGVLICPQLIGSDVTFDQGYRNAPGLYWVGPICLIIGAVLLLIDRARTKRLYNSEEYKDAVRRSERAEKAVVWDSGAPPTTARNTVDILSLSYNRDTGEVDYYRRAMALEMSVFIEDDDLCFFDGVCVYSFKMDQLEGIRLEYNGISLMNWNKTFQYSKEWDKQYGIVKEHELGYGFKYFYTLDISDGGEVYRLAFPAYDISKIAALTGFDAPVPDGHYKPESEKLRPVFYWNMPKNAAAFFAPNADVNFKTKHPVLYVVSSILAFIAFFAPAVAFFVLADHFGGNTSDPRTIIGCVGGLFIGFVLLNYYLAWLHQYLGHKLTLVCLAIGIVLMAVSWIMIV